MTRLKARSRELCDVLCDVLQVLLLALGLFPIQLSRPWRVWVYEISEEKA